MMLLMQGSIGIKAFKKIDNLANHQIKMSGSPNSLNQKLLVQCVGHSDYDHHQTNKLQLTMTNLFTSYLTVKGEQSQTAV